MENDLFIRIKAKLENESFIRSSIAAFASYLNPSMETIQDIKTAVSEAFTNCIVHAYKNEDEYIDINVSILKNILTIKIKDYGVGIKDITKAREAFYTTKSKEERSGMGFTLMEMFMDKLIVRSQLNVGTEVVMEKQLSGERLC